jgi:TIR domain
MTAVFISYSQNDKLVARNLAEELETAGYDVWWDADLLPHDNFVTEISARLEAAKAVIVIWSNHSIDSEYVTSEAERARQLKKLITVRIKDFDPKLLRPPFNTKQASPVENLAPIIAALSKLGVQTSLPHQSSSNPKPPPPSIWVPEVSSREATTPKPKGPINWLNWLAAVIVAATAVLTQIPGFVENAWKACRAVGLCSEVIDKNTPINPNLPIDPHMRI